MKTIKRIMLLGFFVFVTIFLFLGCTKQQTVANSQEQPQAQQNAVADNTANAAANTFTLDEVAKHSSRDDCWMAVHDKIYNVTRNVPIHPGGAAIIEGCGKDATTLFETRPMGSGTPHSEKAREYLAKAYIGDLKK
jgi:cytochrome b involved in lipid metabolism